MRRQDRNQYLALAERHARPGSGTSRSSLRERSARYGTPDLAFLKGRIPFVIVGGLATRLCMPERMTLDADILVTAEDEAEAILRKHDCQRQGPLTIGGSTWLMPDTTILNLVFRNDNWNDDRANMDPTRMSLGLAEYLPCRRPGPVARQEREVIATT